MTSGEHAKRTFRAKATHISDHLNTVDRVHHTPAYNRYHLPDASVDQFMRLSKLPGMAEYLGKEHHKPNTRVPWAYLGVERYNELHRRKKPFPFEKLIDPRNMHYND